MTAFDHVAHVGWPDLGLEHNSLKYYGPRSARAPTCTLQSQRKAQVPRTCSTPQQSSVSEKNFGRPYSRRGQLSFGHGVGSPQLAPLGGPSAIFRPVRELEEPPLDEALSQRTYLLRHGRRLPLQEDRLIDGRIDPISMGILLPSYRIWSWSEPQLICYRSYLAIYDASTAAERPAGLVGAWDVLLMARWYRTLVRCWTLELAGLPLRCGTCDRVRPEVW